MQLREILHEMIARMESCGLASVDGVHGYAV